MAFLLQVTVLVFDNLKSHVKQTNKISPNWEEACMISSLLCWLLFFFFFQGVLNCKPRFPIKWHKTLKLRLTEFWLFIYLRVSSISLFRDPDENPSFTGILLIFFATSHVSIYMGHNSGLYFSTTCRSGTQSDLTVGFFGGRRAKNCSVIIEKLW